MMDIDQVKWFLRAFEGGEKLGTLAVRELYLSGYVGIELPCPGKEPVPTTITEKGKRVLEAEKLRLWNQVYSVAFFTTHTHS